MRGLIAFTFIFVQNVFAASNLETFLATPSFKQYIICLKSCQLKFPLKYYPLEIIRVDLISENDFVATAKLYSSQWQELNQKPYSKKQQADMDALSCNANEALYDLVHSTEIKLGRTLKGSAISIIRFIPTELRTALTAIDSVFLKSSEVGRKASKDLEKKPYMNLMSATFNDKRQVISFEGIPGAWGNLGIAPRIYYELKYSDFLDGKVLFRGGFTGNSDPVGSDYVTRREYLEGRAFNPKSQSFLPLGPYPQNNNTWVDEGGLSHFPGDGHNHSHSH